MISGSVTHTISSLINCGWQSPNLEAGGNPLTGVAGAGDVLRFVAETYRLTHSDTKCVLQCLDYKWNRRALQSILS